MKYFSTKIIAILLAVIVVFSTFSFSIVSHFCGGDLVATSYFGEQNNCGDQHDTCTVVAVKSCCDDKKDKVALCNIATNNKEDQLSKSPCCVDENKLVDTDQYISKFNTKKQTIECINFINTTFSVVNFSEKSIDFSKIYTYKPPLIKQNFQLLFQSFLI